MGPAKPLPPLEERLCDRQEGFRLGALGELLSLEQPRSDLLDCVVERVGDSSETVRVLAVLVLGKFGPAGLAGLIQGLAETQPAAVRIFAASGIAQLGSAGAAAILPLCRCLFADNADVRGQAGFALSRMGTASVPALRRALGASGVPVRMEAARNLGRIGPAALESAADLRRAAQGGPLELQIVCAAALVAVTQDPRNGLFGLPQVAAGSPPETRASVLEQIGELGTLGQPAAPSLFPFLADPDAGVRAACTLALGRMWAEQPQAAPPQIADALAACLGDPEKAVRGNACIALAALGPCSQRAVPVLRQVAGADADEGVRAAAQAAADRIAMPRQ